MDSKKKKKKKKKGGHVEFVILQVRRNQGENETHQSLVAITG